MRRRRRRRRGVGGSGRVRLVHGAPLVLIDAATGDDRVLATSDVQFGLPVGSPDGSRVAAIEAPCSDRQLVSGRAVVIDVPTGRRRERRGRGRRHHVARDGARTARLAYTALRRGDTVFGDIDPVDRRPDGDLVDERERGRVGSVRGAIGDDGFAFVRQGFDRPIEVAIVEGGADRTVASFRHEGHDHARGLVGRAERVTWNAPDGLEIDGFLLAPPGDGPYPLILHVHGGPVWSYRSRSRGRPSPGSSRAATRSSCRTPGARRDVDARSSKP